MLQSLRLLPPASAQFSSSPLRWPTATSGALAPGMWVELQLAFRPESLADQDDSLQLDWQGGRLQVPLRARRPPPALTLPEVSGRWIRAAVPQEVLDGGVLQCWE